MVLSHYTKMNSKESMVAVAVAIPLINAVLHAHTLFVTGYTLASVDNP